jgi:O-antigen ligase
VAGGLVVLAATLMLSRAEAIQRLLNIETGEDARVEAAPTLFTMAGDFFPIGTGFGTFDPVFRYYEPLELLSPKYLNHAHNDLLELIITGGLPGILLLVIFLFWLGKQALRAWLIKQTNQDAALARAASVMVLLALLSSLVDYPLRTPLMAAIFSIACGWLAAQSVPGREVQGRI